MQSLKKKFASLGEKPLSIIIVVILMWIFRLFLLEKNAFPFNADEAIVGLMAKHILGGARPIFFYGQVYMGSLDAYLISLIYWFTGESVLGIRIVQLFLYSFVIIEVYFLVIIVFENKFQALVSGLFLAFPVVNVVLYTTVSLGGYGEALSIGLGVVLLTVIFVKKITIGTYKFSKNYFIYLFLIGLFIGIGLWANALSLIFSMPALVYCIIKMSKIEKNKKHLFFLLFVLIIGSAVGSFLWIYGFLNEGKIVISEMFGSAVAVENQFVLIKYWNHLIAFILFAPTVIFGFRPPWSVSLIALPLIPIVIVCWIVVFRHMNVGKLPSEQKDFIRILFGSGSLLFAGFVFTSFGTDPSGRYFLPFSIIVSIIFGMGIKNISKKGIQFVIISIVIGYQIFGNIKFINQSPFITTQFYEPAQINMKEIDKVVKFLDQNGEEAGYCNYWVAYPLAFLSNEKLICLPQLPYHPDLKYTTRDNRIKTYENKVETSRTAFYITTKNPILDDLLNRAFTDMDVQFSYHEIGDFHIFYDLSKKIIPEELVKYGLKQ